MVQPLQVQVQKRAFSIVLGQFFCVLLLAFFALLLNSLLSMFSVLAGGLAYILPNVFFVWIVFRFATPSQMTQFLAAFMLGEMLKLILSGILFLIIVKTLPVSLLSVLIGFIGAIVSFWIVSLWQFGRTVQ